MELVQFKAGANSVETHNAKTGTTSVRLMTAKEFKDDRGLTGQAGRKAYNNYLREQGQANTAGLAGALTSGKLLVKGYTKTKNGMRVGFMFADSIKDTKSDKAEAAAKELTIEQLQAILAAKQAEVN